MGVTRLKGRPRPWKVDYYAMEVQGGRVVKRRRARFFLNREQADDFWHRKALEADSYRTGLSKLIPVEFGKFVTDLDESYFAYKSKSYHMSEKSRMDLAREWFGDREMHTVLPAEIQARLFGMGDAGYSTKSISNMHGFLSVVFKQAGLRQHVIDNPMPKVPRPAVVPRIDVCALSEIEIARVMKYRGEEKGQILLFIHTGLRMGEMCRVRVERDVDFEANVLHIRSVEGASTKNRKPRTIPLSPTAKAVLSAVRVGPVVAMTRWGLEKRLRAIGGAIGVKINAHRLRHTFCSLNMANGVPEPVVQRWLGHGSATITRRYTHLLGHDQRWATLDLGSAEFAETDSECNSQATKRPRATANT